MLNDCCNSLDMPLLRHASVLLSQRSIKYGYNSEFYYRFSWIISISEWFCKSNKSTTSHPSPHQMPVTKPRNRPAATNRPREQIKNPTIQQDHQHTHTRTIQYDTVTFDAHHQSILHGDNARKINNNNNNKHNNDSINIGQTPNETLSKLTRSTIWISDGLR